MFIFGTEADEGSRPAFSLTACGEAVTFSEPFLIRTPTVALGSAEDNEIHIDDPRVAEHHCRIEVGDMGAYLVDLHSPEGTFLNGKRITRALLREGDTIRLVPPAGAASARIQRPVAEAAAPPSTVQSVELVNKSLPLTQVQRPDTMVVSRQGPDRDRQRLEALLAVSTTLARPDTIENRLTQIVALMLQMMDFDRAGIWVLEPGCPPTAPEPRFAYQAQRSARTPGDGFEVSKTIIRKVLTSEEGLLVKDALFSEFSAAQSVRAQDIRTCVCFPLKTQNVLGVLYADSQRKTENVTEEDLSFVAAFAAQAAVAVENTLLSRKIEQEAVVRSRFERFFPPSALEAVIQAPASVGLGGKEMFVTVLFCDIRNYTSLSFTLEPRQVAHMLNRYFPAMVKCVFRWGGTLEKYIGDALMAIWGAPFEMPPDQQVMRAASAALEMQKAVVGMHPIEIGIGINSGRAFVGNIGDESYLQYAAIGSTTNLAARLCSCAGAGEVILGGDSVCQLPPDTPGLQARGQVNVKGFPSDIAIYSLQVS